MYSTIIHLIQKGHPDKLVRDFRIVEDFDNEAIVSFLLIDKDDTYVRKQATYMKNIQYLLLDNVLL